MVGPRGFVNTSAVISWVSTYWSWISHDSTRSLMKWYCTPMCLTRVEFLVFFARAIAPWLSSYMMVGCFCSNPMSLRRRRSHTASDVAEQSAMYSASHEESAVERSILLYHETTPPATKKQYPPGDFLWIRSPAQSESE